VVHDTGYAPDLVETGFHPLDDAWYPREARGQWAGRQPATCHSCAAIGA